MIAKAKRPSGLPGGLAARQYGLRGAATEAALGFPTLFETAVPAMQAALASGAVREYARIDTLFHLIGVMEDSNLAHRGGPDGLRFAQGRARQFLMAGGVAQPDGLEAVEEICREFERRRLSPGGAADTLAAACWIQRIGALAAVP